MTNVRKDVDKEVSVASSVAPAAALVATTTGDAVDLLGFGAAVVVIHAGVATDGTFVPTLEESNASGSGFTTVAAGNLSGSFADITASADEVVQEVGYLGTKRYIRVVLTESVASAGAFITASVVRARARTLPQ